MAAPVPGQEAEGQGGGDRAPGHGLNRFLTKAPSLPPRAILCDLKSISKLCLPVLGSAQSNDLHSPPDRIPAVGALVLAAS